MGAKPSTASSETLAAGTTDSEIRSRALSASAGNSDSAFGLLRTSSHRSGGAINGTSSSYVRDRGVTDRVTRSRARSLSVVQNSNNGTSAALSIPALLSRATGANTHSLMGSTSGYSETDESSPEDFFLDGPLASLGLSRVFPTHSLPAHLWSFNGFKCPVCSKMVLADDLECHLVICLTKPRITYNEDVLSEDKGECVICFEDLSQGDTIARLPCLCIYHKGCIDEWFQINRSCPGHPFE